MRRAPLTAAERAAVVERIRQIEAELAELAETTQRAGGPKFFVMFKRPAEALRRAREALVAQPLAPEPPPPRRVRLPRLEAPPPPRSAPRLEVLPGGRDGDRGCA